MAKKSEYTREEYKAMTCRFAEGCAASFEKDTISLHCDVVEPWSYFCEGMAHDCMKYRRRWLASMSDLDRAKYLKRIDDIGVRYKWTFKDRVIKRLF